ncbi:single-stranded DNA-binding protein [Patescibacteria group bacterium]
MARSLNKVQLIGNLTRDPEMRYTPAGTAVCTIGMATNRQWVTEAGEKKDAADFHRLVAWNKLAEICAQLLKKGRKVYVEGRLSTRSWTGQDGAQRQTTEIVISDMIILDRKGDAPEEVSGDLGIDIPEPEIDAVKAKSPVKEKEEKKGSKKKTKKGKKEDASEEEDIPF